MARRRWPGRLAAVLCGVLVALVAAEIALGRIYRPSDQFLQPDPVLGVALTPNMTGTWRSSCYETPVRINRWGFRGPDWPREKPAGTLRIAVLGDSLVEGFTVRDDETFVTLLERSLVTPVHGTKVEVLNFGVGSYGTGQSYLNLVHRALAFQPDVVLLAFSTASDVLENSFALEGRLDKPYVRVDGETVSVRAFPYPPSHHTLKAAVRRLNLYRVVGHRITTSEWPRRLLLKVGIGEALSAPLEAELRRPKRATGVPWPFTVYALQYSPAWDEAWAMTGALVDRIRKTAEAHQAAFMVFGIPHLVEVLPASGADALHAGFATGYDPARPHAMLAAMGRRYGFEYLSMRPAFLSDAERPGGTAQDLYMTCDSHLSARGHRLVAETLAPRLAPLLARAAR